MPVALQGTAGLDGGSRRRAHGSHPRGASLFLSSWRRECAALLYAPPSRPLGAALVAGHNTRRPAPPKRSGPSAHRHPGGEELTSPFFFPRLPPNRCVYGVASAAPACIPGRLAADWFLDASAADQAESRISLLHGTPRRSCGVDEARDWPRHSPTERINSRSGRTIWETRTRCARANLFPSAAARRGPGRSPELLWPMVTVAARAVAGGDKLCPLCVQTGDREHGSRL